MDAGPTNVLCWMPLAASSFVAFVTTIPVNKWMTGCGKGHAVAHQHHRSHRAGIARPGLSGPGRGSDPATLGSCHNALPTRHVTGGHSEDSNEARSAHSPSPWRRALRGPHCDVSTPEWTVTASRPTGRRHGGYPLNL